MYKNKICSNYTLEVDLENQAFSKHFSLKFLLE